MSTTGRTKWFKGEILALLHFGLVFRLVAWHGFATMNLVLSDTVTGDIFDGLDWKAVRLD